MKNITDLIDKYEIEMIKKPAQIREVLKDFAKEISENDPKSLNIDHVSGLLPTVTEVSDKCEQDIKSFLNTNTEDELKHYRIAHRRSFEFVIRHIDYNR